MKKQLLFFSIALLSVIGLSSWKMGYFRGHAIVTHDGTCGLSSPMGGGYSIGEAVFVQLPKGGFHASCHFDDVYNPSGRAFVETGFPCMTPSGLTYRTSLTIAPSGAATAICQYK